MRTERATSKISTEPCGGRLLCQMEGKEEKNLTRYRHIVFVLAAGGLLALAMVLLGTRLGRAAGPWYVAPGGDDANDCQSPGTPCGTIHGAIAKASSNDTIYVATGAYTGTGNEVVLMDKDLTLSGGWGGTFTTQPGMSILDGEDVRRGAAVGSGVTAILDHMSIENGSTAWYEPAVDNAEGITPRSSMISLDRSKDPYESGGIYVDDNASLTLNDSMVRNSRAVAAASTSGSAP